MLMVFFSTLTTDGSQGFYAQSVMFGYSGGESSEGHKGWHKIGAMPVVAK